MNLKPKAKQILGSAAIATIALTAASWVHAGPNLEVAYTNLTAKVEQPSVGLCHAYLAVANRFCDSEQGYTFFWSDDETSETRRNELATNLGNCALIDVVATPGEDYALECANIGL